ncbi:MAG: DNA polymerase III subunit delta [Coriobacteriales bacterium]|nr:DNA polymerase III subunit delta [Coriobacteriales bacterium]
MSEQAPKPLLPAYLFVGTDELKRSMLLKRLMGRIEEHCDIALNSASFDAAQVKAPDEVIDACNTMPFASPLRLVLVKNADKAAKPLADALIAYLAGPSDTTVLVATADKLAKNSRLLSAVKKIDPRAVIDCAEKKRSELPSLVQGMAGSRKVGMTLEAAAYTIEQVGTSTIALDSAVEKLVGYVTALGRDSITKGDVKAVVAKSVGQAPWEMLDAFAARQTGRCLELAHDLEGESPQYLFSLIIARLRDLMTAKAYATRGIQGDQALASAMKRPDWQCRRLAQAARSYTAPELRALLALAADTDKRMKSGHDAQLLLSEFILAARPREL